MSPPPNGSRTSERSAKSGRIPPEPGRHARAGPAARVRRHYLREPFKEQRYFILKQAGHPIPANDAWIAALALEHRRPILSRDQHFDAVRGLHR